MKIKILAIACVFHTINIIAQTKAPNLIIKPLTDSFYIYTTYGTYKESKIPAHGMYLVTYKGVVLFDTPWDTTQFQPLLDSILHRHKQKVTMCIATHWHSDRTGGLEYYSQQGIKTYTTQLTDNLSKKNNNKRAEYLIENDTIFNIGQYSFETYYPGKGHTEDNIVIWFEKNKILYGGCLIKGAEAENLGNVQDGSITDYERTLKNVKSKYPHPKYIIVSHHDWTNINSLKHSIKLAKKLKRNKKG